MGNIKTKDLCKMTFKYNRKLLFLILWMGCIFLFSQQNGQESSQTSGILLEILKKLGLDSAATGQSNLGFLVRRAGHFTEYLILGILFLRYYREREPSQKKLLITTVLFVFLYAASDEFHQSFIPGRGPAFTDVLIDTTGGLVGILLHEQISKWRTKKSA